MNNCATGTLATYTPSGAQPWDVCRIQHLYKRMGLGANKDEIAYALTRNPADLIDDIIDHAVGLPNNTPPLSDDSSLMTYHTNVNSANIIHLRSELFYNLLGKGADTTIPYAAIAQTFKEKLTVFWHDHFAVEVATFGHAVYYVEYLHTLQEYALGNFQEFTKVMGKTGAMLLYLDGRYNYVNNINENYARELMELFTLGEGNGYTEQDVGEMARALTGWTYWIWTNPTSWITPNSDPPTFQALRSYGTPSSPQALPNEFQTAYFHNGRFDNTNKTILGVTANFDFDGAHDLIFQERTQLVANFICTKLYKQYVSQAVDSTIIAGLANTFMTNNFQIAPVLKQLFKSEHFFDTANIGCLIKSPIDFLLGTIHTANLLWEGDCCNISAYHKSMGDYLYNSCSGTGMKIFSPPNVAGWTGHRAWIDENYLAARWEQASTYFLYVGANGIGNPGQGHFNLLAEVMALIPDPDNTSSEEVCTKMAELFLPFGFVMPNDLTGAIDVFQSIAIPYPPDDWNAFSLSYASMHCRVGDVLYYLARMPEFNLC